MSEPPEPDPGAGRSRPGAVDGAPARTQRVLLLIALTLLTVFAIAATAGADVASDTATSSSSSTTSGTGTTLPATPTTTGTTTPPAGGLAALEPEPTVVPQILGDSSITWTTRILPPLSPFTIVEYDVVTPNQSVFVRAGNGIIRTAELDSSGPSTITARGAEGFTVTVEGDARCPDLGEEFQTTSGENLNCTYIFGLAASNTTLTIVNAVRPVTATSTSFAYATSGGTSTSFTLIGAGSEVVSVPLDTAFTLTETLPAGWVSTMSGEGCPSATSSGNTLTASFNMAGPLTCTVTNTQLASISIDKVTNPPGDPTSFDFVTGGGLLPASFSLTDVADPQEFVNVTPDQPYTFTETVPSGWSLEVSGTGCVAVGNVVTVTPIPGQAVSCTFTNTKLSALVVEKTAVGGDGTFTITGGPGGSRSIMTVGGVGSTTYADVVPGTYTLVETPVPGWVAGSFGGACSTGGTVVVPVNGIVTCTITNTKLASISIDKVTNPPGDPTAFAFAVSGDLSPASFSLTDAATPQQFVDVAPDVSYTFTETVPAGWSLAVSGAGCVAAGNVVTVTPTPGQAVSCVFTNTKLASISIDKVTVPGGSLTPFTFSATGGLLPASFSLTDAATPQVFVNVTPGVAYTITESVPAGWALETTGPGCVETTDGVTVTPAPGEVVSCIFRNTNLAVITINKVTVPAGDPTAFDFAASGGLTPASFDLADGESQVFDASPGVAYTITESVPPGWSLATSGTDCVATTNGVTVTPVAGQVVSCTFTNTKLATIAIDKVTLPSGDPTSFGFTATGGLDPFSLTDAAEPQVLEVLPGQPYTITESVPPGWSLATSGTGCVATTNGVTVTPVAGQVVSCTFTNTKLATIAIDKVTNPSGDLTSFAFSTTGGLTPPTFNLADATAAQVFTNVTPGVSYTFTETVPAGWSLEVSGTGCEAVENVVTVTPAPGQAVSCTFTNTKLSALVVEKTALGGDGTFTITGGPGGNRSITTVGGVGSTTYAEVPPGTYTLVETPVPGWVAGPFDGDCAEDGTVVVPVNGIVTCTITNTKLASISIDKVTLPAGDATSFPFTTTGGLLPASFSLTDGAAPQVFANVTPGVPYTFSEAVPTGWSLVASGDGCVVAGNVVTVTPTPGQAVSCVFTNTKFATILIDKETVPGGDPTSFSFVATGGLSPGTFELTDEAGPQGFLNVAPNQTYTILEDVPTSSSWSLETSGTGCIATARGVIVTPSPGQVVSCVFTNHELSTIVIEKVTDPPGDPTSFSFTATGGLTPASFSLTDGESLEFSDVAPGVPYTITESVPAGWSLVVSGGSSCSVTANVATVTPIAGELVRCTFTNTELASISIDKVTNPPGDLTSFSFAATGGLSPVFSLTDASDPQQFVNVAPDQAYTFTEAVTPGWSLEVSGTGCTATANGVIVRPDPGQAVSCVFTNTKLASISIDKVTLPTGELTSFEFTTTGGLLPASFSLTDAADPQEFTNVTPGQAYTFTEAVPAGWSLVTSGAGCTATTNGVTVTPVPGQIVACTFTNTKLATITIEKSTVGGDATFTFTEPTLGSQSVATSAGSGSATFANVAPGAYTFAETPQAGWAAGPFAGSCDATGTVTVTAGQAATCTFTNTGLASITIDKTTVGGDGTFVFTAAGLAPQSITTTANAGSATYVDVAPGTYTFAETPQAGWAAGPFAGDCDATGTVTVAAGGSVTCSITNTELATITIDKTAVGGDAEFTFTEPTLGSQSTTTSAGTGSVTFTNVTPGIYTFAETPVAGWTAGPFGGDCGTTGSIAVTAGQTATCTITNDREATIVIAKSTVPPGDPTTFEFTATGGITPASFTLTDGGTQSFTATPGQTYTITESMPTDWMMVSAGTGCTSVAGGVSVTPQPGATLTCTFTNIKLAPIITPNPDTAPPGSPVDLTLTGYPPNTTLTVVVTGPDGQTLGPFSVTTDSSGNATLRVNIPPASPPGTYAVAVSGAGFTPVTSSFIVTSTPTTIVLSPTTLAPPNAATAARNETSGNTGGSGFAVTGSRSGDLVVLAAALLAAGLGIGSFSRRRRRKTTS